MGRQCSTHLVPVLQHVILAQMILNEAAGAAPDALCGFGIRLQLLQDFQDVLAAVGRRHRLCHHHVHAVLQRLDAKPKSKL